ncbi:hypothetical protein BQ8794_10010 [Mesorhizobium prunaredense]|uniref:Uncharacterized protein n=1 Tax=Mesorhizobium prunaredense TaxID=1631249 RepID=A0A1R3UYC3_9HYPH|nr:hypothetical protein BQ8794_10010 [Mesorhizobium prunaredense]
MPNRRLIKAGRLSDIAAPSKPKKSMSAHMALTGEILV